MCLQSSSERKSAAPVLAVPSVALPVRIECPSRLERRAAMNSVLGIEEMLHPVDQQSSMRHCVLHVPLLVIHRSTSVQPLEHLVSEAWIIGPSDHDSAKRPALKLKLQNS